MTKRSKKYREAAEKVDRSNLYTASEAIALLKSMPARGFDETVEAVYNLNVDPRKADQLVRGTVNLPNGTGKTARVIVFAHWLLQLSKLVQTKLAMQSSSRRYLRVTLTSMQ